MQILQHTAIAKTVQAREATNQQLIKLLEKMYDDIKPAQPPEEVLKFQQVTEALRNFPPEVAADILKESAKEMFGK